VLRALLAIAALASLGHARARRHAGPILAVLVALDLGAAVLPEFRSLRRSRRAARSAVAAAPRPRRGNDPHARVYVGAAAPVHDPRVATGQYAEAYTNAWSDWRVRNLTGNLGAFPAGWTLVMELGMTRSLAALAAWGVSWFDVDRAAPPIPGATPAAEDERARVYPCPARSAGCMRCHASPRCPTSPRSRAPCSPPHSIRAPRR
jgi:hypothetical protein